MITDAEEPTLIVGRLGIFYVSKTTKIYIYWLILLQLWWRGQAGVDAWIQLKLVVVVTVTV